MARCFLQPRGAAPETRLDRGTRLLAGFVSVAVVACAALYVLREMRPDLLLRDTTTNGGDMGAHVWWPAYLRDHVLPKLRLSGWAPDYYAGFPVGHFYFPLPAILVVVADLILPYNVAFKLGSAAGVVLLPVGAAFCLWRLGAPPPAAPLGAVATLPYLYYTGYQIWGGNLASNLAGEFSFSLSLALSLFAIGSLARALREHRRLASPAMLLAAVALSHLIVAIFAIVAAVAVWLVTGPRRSLRAAAAVGAVAISLTGVWSVPMVARLGYATDMGWMKLLEVRQHLLPPEYRWALVLAVVAVVAGLAVVRRSTIALMAVAGVFALGFVLFPETRLWNARLLPFYYLALVLLAAIGGAEIVGAAEVLGSGLWRRASGAMGALTARRRRPSSAGPGAEDDGCRRQAEAVVVDQADPAPPATAGPVWLSRAAGAVACSVALAVAIAHTSRHEKFLPGWVAWNYSGYEAKPAYPEFSELMETMGSLPPGRAFWERSSKLNDYGTDLALELLPYFTDGRIPSMEGLYFESSATTPYHFLTAAEVAKEPSNPVRGLTYRSLADFDLGVRHLKLLGVRYYMAASDEAKALADAHPELSLAAETGSPEVAPKVARWRVYEVVGSALVVPLSFEPVVMDPAVGPGKWLSPSADWFNDPGSIDRHLAAAGPASWARVPAAGAAYAPRRPLPAVEVDGVRSRREEISFRVSRIGVPILVRTSYFPNWKAQGAQGPFRVTPNFMVVVPTERQVRLYYGRTPVDLAGTGLSLAGLVGLVLLARWRPRKPSPEAPPEGPSDGATEEPYLGPNRHRGPARARKVSAGLSAGGSSGEVSR